MNFLICDGLNIVRRVYEANMAPDSAEKAEYGMRAAFGSFKRALREQQPSHALVAFDHGGPTWRHELHPDYKANRKPMSEHLRAALPGFKERLTKELGLVTVTKPGVEADDVMAVAYIGWETKFPGKPATILSTDKDMTALVELGAIVYDQFNAINRDAAWIKETWGILPSQVQDYLALMGDAVDNVPGVPGVGKKTAMELLNRYGTLDAVLAADIPGALGARIAKHREVAELSRELVGFKIDLRLGLKFTDLAL